MEMKVGTKIEMDNGPLGIQQGVIYEDDGWEGTVRWDTPDEFDNEQLGDNFHNFKGKVLPDNWKFTHINDDGSLK